MDSVRQATLIGKEIKTNRLGSFPSFEFLFCVVLVRCIHSFIRRMLSCVFCLLGVEWSI